MSQTPDQPTLKPSFCFNQTALRDFLRVSRGAIDDTIAQNLNALATPAATPFDPRSTGTRQLRNTAITSSSGSSSSSGNSNSSNNNNSRGKGIDGAACREFKQRVLFPAWQGRSDVLNYCAGVATSPDPDDPEHVLREHADARARERVVDERLDPYSARYFPQAVRTEALAALVRNERMVEDIIRARTWGVVGERCDNDELDADAALNEWRRHNASTVHRGD